MFKLDVLFITDDFRIEPLGIGYLASYLKKEGFNVDLIKYKQDYDPTLGSILFFLKRVKVDLIAYSATSNQYPLFLKINKAIKRKFPTLKSVIGGIHASCYPNDIDLSFDYVIRGEGEQNLANLLHDIKMGRKVERIRDFFPLETDLDKLPFPNRKLMYRYSENYYNPIKYIFATRGCRFGCSYCFNLLYKQFYKGQKWVRSRSVNNIIEECREILNYPVKMIFFHEDDFLVHPDLDNLLITYKREINIPFHCSFRIELLTEEIAKKLKAAGCYSVSLGLEAGNDYIRKRMLYRNVEKNDIFRGCKLLRKYGIKFRLYCMCGIPEETFPMMIETLDTCIKCKPTMGRISFYQPYLKQPLAEHALDLGLWDGRMDNIKSTYFEETVLKFSFNGKLTNFQRLFGTIVRYPFLRLFLKLLLIFPKNRLFNWLYTENRKQGYRELFNVCDLNW